MTTRKTPGSDSDAPACLRCRIASPIPNVLNDRIFAHDHHGHEVHEPLKRHDDTALRDGGQCRPDHACGVLTGNGQNAKGAERDLRNVEALQDEVGGVKSALVGVEVVDVLRRTEYSDANSREGSRNCGPVGRSHGAQLRPFRTHDVRRPDRAWRRHGCRLSTADRGRGHDATVTAASVRKSTLSLVSSMNASSNEAERGVNSCTAI